MVREQYFGGMFSVNAENENNFLLHIHVLEKNFLNKKFSFNYTRPFLNLRNFCFQVHHSCQIKLIWKISCQ